MSNNKHASQLATRATAAILSKITTKYARDVTFHVIFAMTRTQEIA